MLLDLERQKPLAEALVKLSRQGAPNSRLFTATASDVMTGLRWAEQVLGLEVLGPLHGYQLRHTGASHDWLNRSRDLAGVQRRGRWRDPRSVRRYEKGGRVTQQLARLPAKMQAHAARCAAVIGDVVRGRRSALPVP